MREEEGTVVWGGFMVSSRQFHGQPDQEARDPTFACKSAAALLASGQWKTAGGPKPRSYIVLSPNSTGPDRPLPRPDTLLGHSPMLLEDSRGNGMPRVRRMDPSEAWQISGGTMRDWKSGLREGVTYSPGRPAPFPPARRTRS